MTEHDNASKIHWTQLPENKERLHKARLEGARTLAENRKRNRVGRKGKAKPIGKTHTQVAKKRSKHAADKVVHERSLRRVRDRKYRKNKLQQETTNHAEEEHQIDPKVEEASRIAFTHCDTWISLYAEFHGLPQSAVTRWVGQALVRKSSR